MGLAELKSKLQSVMKGTHIEMISDSDMTGERLYFKSPSLDLNRILSGSLNKGLPSKSLTLLVAPEASFKSSSMVLLAADAQKQGQDVIIIDTEGAYTNEFISRWGLNPSNVLYIYTPWISEVMTIFGQIIDDKDAKNMFIILDSLGGLERSKMVDDANSKDHVVKADQGTLQKDIKRLLKMMLFIVKGKQSTGIISGHFFGNPNSYGGADEIGGGKFAKLAPDIIISQKREIIYANPNAKASERVVTGSRIKALTLKNRFYPPFQEAEIMIDYNSGVNPFAGLLDMAIECGIIELKGAWYTLPDGKKVQGSDKVIDYFTENPDTIIKNLEDILEKTGYSNINEEVKEAESMKEECEGTGFIEVDEELIEKGAPELIDTDLPVTVKKRVPRKK